MEAMISTFAYKDNKSHQQLMQVPWGLKGALALSSIGHLYIRNVRHTLQYSIRDIYSRQVREAGHELYIVNIQLPIVKWQSRCSLYWTFTY